jgi:hypothetical protein
MTTKAQQAEKTEAIEKLQAILSRGDTLHTILRNVSSSGMSRVISVVYVDPQSSEILNLDYLISQLGVYKRTPSSSRHDGLKVGGVGMDMGFAVVYDISQTVFNDGYALKQRWL